MDTTIQTMHPGIQFFIKLFELGNTIRGWSGEGPYVPLDTRPLHEFQDNVIANLCTFAEFLETMDPTMKTELNDLPLVKYGDTFSLEKISIGTRYESVVTGRYSTFMASGNFIATAVYYLREKYQYTIPGVDITELKHFY